MKLRFLIITAMMALATLQLNAQEQDYEYKYEAVSLTNREMIVHSRSFSWDPFDHTDNKNSFEFDVPVNTVAIMYAYCSRLSEVQIPELKLCAGITQCIGSIASFGNKSLGAGIDKIAEGLNGLSLPTGTGDVDIYLFVEPEDILKFKQASSSECEQKYYYPEFDLLSQKSGKKTIKLDKPVEKRFTIYLGLLNKDLDDAITVRLEAIAITATKVPIAKSVDNSTIQKAAELPPSQNTADNGNVAFVIILVVIGLGAVGGLVFWKMKQGKKETLSTKQPEETEELKKMREKQSIIENRINEAQKLNIKISDEIEVIKSEANKAIASLYGDSVPYPQHELYSNYDSIINNYGNGIDETPKMQCDRNVKDAKNAIHERYNLIEKNKKVIAKGQGLIGKLNKQREIQSQIEKQKQFNKTINASNNNSESDIANQIYGTEMMDQLNDDFINFENEIEQIRNTEIELGSIKI